MALFVLAFGSNPEWNGTVIENCVLGNYKSQYHFATGTTTDGLLAKTGIPIVKEILS